MEKIDFKKQNIPFTQVANGVLYDKNISLGAKAVYAFMYSKPDGWQFSAQRIAIELQVNKKTILTHLRELKEYGYLLSQKLPNGRMLYKVIFPPIDPESEMWTMAIDPESEKAIVQKSHGAKNGPISNKEVIVINNTSNTNSKSLDLQVSKEVPLIIESFIKVNKACADFYGNTTQRKYVEKLITTYGVEKVTRVVDFLPQLNLKLYNKATTPKELWDKWAKIEAEAQSLKEHKKSNKYQVTKIH